MSQKPHAGEAGPDTPVAHQQAPLDPFGGFQRDDLRLKAVESQHETAKAIATTQARAGVLRIAIPAVAVAVVLVFAMTLGVPPPWELALSALLGKLMPSSSSGG